MYACFCVYGDADSVLESWNAPATDTQADKPTVMQFIWALQSRLPSKTHSAEFNVFQVSGLENIFSRNDVRLQ